VHLSDSDPASPSEMMADEPTAPVPSKRKTGAAKAQPPAPKDFDPFDADMDEGRGDATTASKRRRHGLSHSSTTNYSKTTKIMYCLSTFRLRIRNLHQD